MLASLSRKAERNKAQFDSLSPGQKAIRGLGFLLVGLVFIVVAYVIKDTNWGESSRFGSTTLALQFFAVLFGAIFTLAALDIFLRAMPTHIRRWLGLERLSKALQSEGRLSGPRDTVLFFVVLAAGLGILSYINGWF